MIKNTFFTVLTTSDFTWKHSNFICFSVSCFVQFPHIIVGQFKYYAAFKDLTLHNRGNGIEDDVVPIPIANEDGRQDFELFHFAIYCLMSCPCFPLPAQEYNTSVHKYLIHRYLFKMVKIKNITNFFWLFEITMSFIWFNTKPINHQKHDDY